MKEMVLSMLGEAPGSKSYIMMLEEMPESVFVDMDTGDVDVCEERSHKNSLVRNLWWI